MSVSMRGQPWLEASAALCDCSAVMRKESRRRTVLTDSSRGMSPLL